MNRIKTMPVIDIVTAFDTAARLKPATPFMVTERGKVTYGEVISRAHLLAALFRGMGLDIGDRVIIATSDDRAAVTIFLSLLRCGITAIPINPQSPAPAANILINSARPKGLFIDESLFAVWKPETSAHVIRISGAAGRPPLFDRLLGKKEPVADPGTYPAILATLSPSSLPATVLSGTDAFILFTSGTTALPKGVRISHKALFTHLRTLGRQFGYDQATRLLNLLPLYHTDGLTQGPLGAFCACAAVYRHVPFSIQAIPAVLDAICAERITHFIAVPTMLAMINAMADSEEDCFSSPGFRFIISTAGYLDRSLWERLEARFGKRVANVYGLTETVTGSLFSGPDNDSHRIGTIGKPVDCKARIVNDEGLDLPDGEAGEMLLCGDHLMNGYFDDQAATDAVLRNGWLSTGDLAVRDSDGFYRISGRKKNIIITGGLNIQPEEVTEVLLSHPAVLEAVTFGIPDDTWGELLVACVVPVAGDSVDETILAEHCRANLMPYKVPSRIQIVAELPKGPSGKIIIERAREQASRPHGAATAPLAGDLAGKIINIAASCFRISAQSLSLSSSQSKTPGWDSLGHMALVTSLEETFRISFAPSDIIKLSSLQDAERIVREKL